eukprot:6203401-Pleurochrysis_carterae.AAC.2
MAAVTEAGAQMTKWFAVAHMRRWFAVAHMRRWFAVTQMRKWFAVVAALPTFFITCSLQLRRSSFLTPSLNVDGLVQASVPSLTVVACVRLLNAGTLRERPPCAPLRSSGSPRTSWPSSGLRQL